MQREDVYLVLLGGDLKNDGNELGEESKLRCIKAAKIFRNEGNNGNCIRIVSSAGRLLFKYPQQKCALSILMFEFLNQEMGIDGEFFLADHRALNSAAELITAAVIIKKFRETYRNRRDHVHNEYRVIITSSWYHLLRLKYLWRKYCKNENLPKPEFVAAPWTPNLFSLIREVGAWIGALTGLRGPRWASGQPNGVKPKVAQN